MKTKLRHPGVNITNNFAIAILEKQFNELSPVKIRCIWDGLDNKVFFVNDRYIFKFPHRETAALIIQRENAILKVLQKFVNLQIPKPIYTGNPIRDYPYYFYGYQMILGKPACSADLSIASRNASATKLAEFLKRLHSIPETKTHIIGIEDQVFDRTDVNKVIASLRKGVEKINSRKVASINMTVLNEEIKIAASVNLPKMKVLVHGDLYCRHLLFDNDDLIGIIDWGHVGLNHPAVDLSIVFSFYHTNCHQAFFDIYGAIDSKTYTYARFLGLYSTIMVMLYAHEINDVRLFQEVNNAMLRINPKLLKRK